MNHVPDWFWQNVISDFFTEGLGLALWLAWKYRKQLADKLRRSTPQPVVLSAQGIATPRSRSSASGTLTVSKDCMDLRGNVEAPTPSLTRRLEELASWYLHVS
jgi:hypothetical protein